MSNKIVMTFEAYQTYSDYQNPKKGNWGSPEDLVADVKLTVKHTTPTFDDKWIKSIADQSDDAKGIKFEIKLSTGDILHAFKIGSMRGSWELYLNKKKKSQQEIRTELIKKSLSPLEQWELAWKSHDTYYNYSDSHDVWKSGVASEKNIVALYDKLCASDKKKAYKIYTERDNQSTKSFPEFKGL